MRYRAGRRIGSPSKRSRNAAPRRVDPCREQPSCRGRTLIHSGAMNPLIGQYADRLLDSGVAGTRTSHGAENNLYKIGLLLEADENNTFGMEDLLRGVTFDEAYDAVSHQIGNSPDREENPGRGCIDPARTAAGLVEAGGRLRDVAEAGGRLVFATG